MYRIRPPTRIWNTQWPTASPTVHGGKVYTLGTQGHLVCLDAATGEVMWKKHLVEDFHGRIPRTERARHRSSSAIFSSCARRPTRGERRCAGPQDRDLRWQALPDRPAYSAPIVITAGGTGN